MICRSSRMNRLTRAWLQMKIVLDLQDSQSKTWIGPNSFANLPLAQALIFSYIFLKIWREWKWQSVLFQPDIRIFGQPDTRYQKRPDIRCKPTNYQSAYRTQFFLESSTYEVFERDPVKYSQYQLAVKVTHYYTKK